VHLMAPAAVVQAQPLVDITAAMSETPRPRAISLKVVAAPPPAPAPAPVADDPFEHVEV